MSTQCCGTCKWAVDLKNQEDVDCNYPLPAWISRFTHDPLTGYGACVSMMKQSYGEHCPTYEAKS